MSTIREFKGNSLLDFVNDYVVVDIETTGFSSSVNEIIEIGAIRVLNNEVIDSYHVLIKIDNEIPQNIVNLTGITDDLLKEKGILINEAISSFINFVGENIVVGHNINFDINFLYDNCIKYTGKPFKNDFIDTMRIAKNFVKDTYNHKLTTLAKKFEIHYDNHHRALNDVMITNELYKKLKFLKENYIEIRMKEIQPYLTPTLDYTNKKVSIKSKLKYLDNTLVEAILKIMNTKTYPYFAKYANILLVNDSTYEKLQKPLDNNDPYMIFYNEWMFKAQKRMNENDLIIVSETEFCNKIGIPIKSNIQKEEDISNPLYQKHCVFTGALERMNRNQAETIVSSIGGIIDSGVTRKTSYLILGNNDYNSAVKNGKSSKHKKAEELQNQGYEIQIIPEDLFYEMIGEE